MRHLSKKSALIAVGLLSAMLLGVVFATLVWQMTGTHQMKLKYAYGIKIELLLDDVWTEVDDGYGYDWGEFLDGETKSLNVRLTNIGNVQTYPAWNGDNFENGNWMEGETVRWTLTADLILEQPYDWPQDKPSWSSFIPGACYDVIFYMTEVEALASEAYSFGLTIENHDVS